MTNVMYQDLTVKNTIDATSVGTNLLTAIRADAYEVGDVYISTNATSPASKYGGTWEQLDEDAYFKIVTSGAGSYGGTSNEHKIPLTSIPSTTNSITAHPVGGPESSTRPSPGEKRRRPVKWRFHTQRSGVRNEAAKR